MSTESQPRIAIVGLGYVGLPLAVEFGNKFRTIGYDMSQQKVTNYAQHMDPAGQVPTEDLWAAAKLAFSREAEALRTCVPNSSATPEPRP